MNWVLSSRNGQLRNVSFIEEMVLAKIRDRKTKTVFVETVL